LLVAPSPTNPWDGTSVIGNNVEGYDAGPGEILEFPLDPYSIANGTVGQIFGWRVWNLTREEMETFCTRPGEELWYTTGVEYGAWDQYAGGNPLDPWMVGAPDGISMYNLTGDPFYRSQNVLDHHLATCGGEPIIPEPGTMLLIAGSALLLVLRRKK
jgi:hypothetical protein